MRLLSKLLLVSITGVAVMAAAFAGIGISIIDDVLYQNSIRVLNAQIGSVTRSLETPTLQTLFFLRRLTPCYRYIF
jgi:hypothetical protein